ncbi:MAG: PPOX class F420-dependent oxidoreductase [Mycobacteriales bacterium]
MSAFTESERAYLRERRLARLATVGANGMPHVTPVGMWTLSATDDVIEVSGRDFAATKKYRDVAATGRAAIVIDDMASTDPWRPRGIEIRGHAESVTGSEPHIVIHPDRVVSWGLDSAPGSH